MDNPEYTAQADLYLHTLASLPEQLADSGLKIGTRMHIAILSDPERDEQEN